MGILANIIIHLEEANSYMGDRISETREQISSR
jgi:hypothetical protein